MQFQNHRRESFKTPPIALAGASQQSRRDRALELQRRKREQRVQSSRIGLDHFANLSLNGDAEDSDDEPEIVKNEGIAQYAKGLRHASPSSSTKADTSSSGATSAKSKRKTRSRWTDVCMYAELLEMVNPDILELSGSGTADGIPDDLEAGNWLAIVPPVGKRCLAVSTQFAGSSVAQTGSVIALSKISLKSRLKGNTLLTFPSVLPPDTILDCILDADWRTNGLLHVLDVLKWKGQELCDGEALFRLWWRDQRLSELGDLHPYPFYESDRGFKHPVTLLGVPYHQDLSYSALLDTVIPVARSQRHVQVYKPAAVGATSAHEGMDVDHVEPDCELVDVSLNPDGLLLYVAQASYESGTSPLSVWVPSRSLDLQNVVVQRADSPLEVFHRLIALRVDRQSRM